MRTFRLAVLILDILHAKFKRLANFSGVVSRSVSASSPNFRVAPASRR